MDLHANAALSLNKRRLLGQRVVEEDWSLTWPHPRIPTFTAGRLDAGTCGLKPHLCHRLA